MLHRVLNLFAAQLIPGGCNNGCIRIFLFDQPDCPGQLFCAEILRPAQNNAGGVFQLIIIKFTKIFGIDFAFGGIGHGCKAIEDVYKRQD